MAEVEKRLIEQEINQGQETVTGLVDVQKRREEDVLPPGVESWMQRVEKAVPQTTINDSSTGQTVLQPAAAPTVTTKTTPVTRKTFARGFKMAVNEANRWLSEFIFRFIKMNGGNVQFKKEEVSN